MFSRNSMWVGYHLRDSGSGTARAIDALRICPPHHTSWQNITTESKCSQTSVRWYYQFPICFILTCQSLSFHLGSSSFSCTYRSVMAPPFWGSEWALELVNLPLGQEKLKTCVWLCWFSIRKRIFLLSFLLEEETPYVITFSSVFDLPPQSSATSTADII